MKFELTWRRGLTLTVVLLLSWVFWFQQISDSPIEGDSQGTLTMAVNLAHYGIISIDKQPPFSSSMYREPGPVLANALAVLCIDTVMGPANLEAYFSGDRAKYLKYQNILWLSLLCIAAFVATFYLTCSFSLSILAMPLAYLPFLYVGMRTFGIDTLLTEIPAAAVLVAGSLLLMIGIGRRNLMFIAFAGFAFGLLALIKAAALYMFIGLAVLLIAVSAMVERPFLRNEGIVRAILLSVCFGTVTLPWMYRNYVEFGQFAVADRGGLALYLRALKNGMTPGEYLGSFYVWAPTPLRPIVGSILGFSRSDLQRGNRLERLAREEYHPDFARDDLAAERGGRPDKAISLWRQSRAERVKLRRQFAADGSVNPNAAADGVLMRRGMQMIRQKPLSHLAMTIPMLWRGALVTFPMYVIVLFYAIRRHRWDLALFCLPAFGLIMFHGLATNFEPRYGAPMYSAMILAVAVLLYCIGMQTRARRQRATTVLAETASS